MNSKELKEFKVKLEALKAKRLQAATQGNSSNKTAASIEMKACAKWGVKSYNDLLQLNTAEKKFAYISHEEKAAVRELKEAVDVCIMIAQRFGMNPTETKQYKEGVLPVLKALGTDSGDDAANFVPTIVSSSYIEEYNLERKVAGLFQEIKMPSSLFVYPVLSNGAIATKLGENAAKSPVDTFKTDQTITLSAVKIASSYELPEELNEDSAVDVMKVIRMELINGQEKAMEIAILEGDTAGSHQHTNTQIPGASGAPASESSERLFDGLRKRALAAGLKKDAGNNKLNEGHLADARSQLGKYGVNPAELALIADPKGYVQMLQLDDVRTMEQYGPKAPVLTGQLASYEGIPVIVSEWLRADTDATGINGGTSGNNTRLSVVLVNRKRFFCGLRRAIQVRVENFRTKFDVWDMVSFSRRAFQGILKADGSNAAGEKSVCLIYNIAA